MNKEQAAAWYSLYQRIVGLGENLMLRQNPSEVNNDTARRCYEAAREFYFAVDEDAREAEGLIGKNRVRDQAAMDEFDV